MTTANVIHASAWGGTGFLDSMEMFVNYKVATGSAVRTVNDYRSLLSRFFLLYPQAWNSPAEMRAAILSWLSDDIANATYNHRLLAVRTFWRWCVEEEIQPEKPNPFRGLKQKKAATRALIVDANKVKEMLERIDRSTWLGVRDYALILFTLDTATRPGEALQLRILDFNFRLLSVIIPQGAAKTREERAIPFSAATAQALKKLIDSRPQEWKDDIPVFCSSAGSQMTVSDWHHRLRRAYRFSDGSFFRPYDLRHAACTLHLRAGMTGEALQRLMGHHGPQMTQRYIHLTLEDLREQQAISSPVERLAPLKKRAPRKVKD